MANLGVGAGATVTAQMDADFFLGLVGNKTIVLDVGRHCEAEIVDNNHVKIHDGTIVSQGRYLHIPANTFDTFELETGTQGIERYDVLAYRIFKENGQEKSEMFIQKDVGAPGNVANTNLETPILRDGAEETYVPMYRAKVDGITLAEVVPLYDRILTPITELDTKIERCKLEFNAAISNYHKEEKIDIDQFPGDEYQEIKLIENESYYYPGLGIAVINARFKQTYKKACTVNYEDLIELGSISKIKHFQGVEKRPVDVIVGGNYTRRYVGMLDGGMITARTNTSYSPTKGSVYNYFVSAVYTIKKEG